MGYTHCRPSRVRVTYTMGTKCKTGGQRQALRDALREIKTNGFAWLNRDGYRLKLCAPYLPNEGQTVDALVRNGNRVEQQTIVGKDAGCRLRVYNTGRRGSPNMVLATIEERHPIAGAKQNGSWGTSVRDRYPGYPRTYPEGVSP